MVSVQPTDRHTDAQNTNIDTITQSEIWQQHIKTHLNRMHLEGWIPFG